MVINILNQKFFESQVRDLIYCCDQWSIILDIAEEQSLVTVWAGGCRETAGDRDLGGASSDKRQ